jgi:hypothetical protein
MRSSYFLTTLALATLACSLEAPNVADPGLSHAGTSNDAGTDSGTPQAGTSSVPAGGMNAGGNVATAGTSSSAGSSLGGASSTAGSAAGGSSTGGSSTGGSSAGGNATAGSASGGGGSGSTDYSDVAKAIEGLRIDDPCTGAVTPTPGATCNHVMNPFHVMKDVTIAGTPGTTYDVTLRIRGVVEPTKITGGTRPDMSTIQLNGKTYRKVPYTVGGTPGDVTYQPWLFSVASPPQNYFFNDYGLTEHSTFLLDYQVTIPMSGGTKVTLDVNDGNDHEISNYASLKNDGIPGSMNYGQYLQFSVVSVKPQ